MAFTLTKEDINGLSDDQLAAIFESLVTAVFADGRADPVEIERFEKEVEAVPWGKAAADVQKIVQASKARVAKLANAQDVMTFIQAIAARLTKQDVREKVLRMMGSLMFSDKNFVNDEMNILSAFSEVFQIPGARLDEIRLAASR